jgi:tRNA-splicing ligase RtcB
MMPDAHQGYGFPIGGVAAFDTESGIISPGGVGFDINCGVRVLSTPLSESDVRPRIKELLEGIFQSVPCGVGGSSHIRLNEENMAAVLNKGAEWAVENGHGLPEDLRHCEEYGKINLAKPEFVSARAKARGKDQLGTLGAGNHFLEVQVVDKIYKKDVAEHFGILKEGQVVFMLHCGSRGLGHQVCSDYLRKLEEEYPAIMEKLPEKDLIYAPANSKTAQEYFGAMCSAANYAFANRQIIGNQVRKVFVKLFNVKPEEIRVVYDVCHNMAKLEEHDIDGVKKKVYVHRKGATRAFGPGKEEIPEDYRDIGQPVLIPGSMGTASWILVGTNKAMHETFGSTAHGAGRTMSRAHANRSWTGEQIKKELADNNILVRSASWRGISEEAPQAYKDVDEVVKVSHEAGIGELVARLTPIGVVKG